MQVELTPAQERIITAAVSSGRYHDATEVLDDALHVLEIERLGNEPMDIERQQAIERIGRFGKQHGLTLGAGLTVKDLINEGRR